MKYSTIFLIMNLSVMIIGQFLIIFKEINKTLPIDSLLLIFAIVFPIQIICIILQSHFLRKEKIERIKKCQFTDK